MREGAADIPGASGTAFPSIGNESAAQSLSADGCLMLKAQSLSPVFSSSILSNLIELIDPTSCRITHVYFLHHEHRRTSACRLRASWKGQEATQTGDGLHNRQSTSGPEIPTPTLSLSFRCHVRRVHWHLSIPLLRLLRHPSCKHPNKTSDVHYHCSGFQSRPASLHQLVLRLLLGRQRLGVLSHLWRALQPCRHAGNVSRRGVAIHTRRASRRIPDPRCHCSDRGRQRAISRAAGRPDRAEDRHFDHPGSLHRDVPYRSTGLHHLHACG